MELSEIMGGGAAKKLFFAFNRKDIPLQIFVIFTNGDVDFVGGYTYWKFLTQNIGCDGKSKVPELGKVDVGCPSGEDIHK